MEQALTDPKQTGPPIEVPWKSPLSATNPDTNF